MTLEESIQLAVQLIQEGELAEDETKLFRFGLYGEVAE